MALKVWICASDNGTNVQNSVNEFIKDKRVIDIKYQALFNHGTKNINDRALVVYTEEVKRGVWIGVDEDECSVCHRSIREIMDADSYYAIGFDVCDDLVFCPFCGAKMIERNDR